MSKCSTSKITRLPTIDDCGDCGVCCLHMGYPPYLRGEAEGGEIGSQPEEAWTQMPPELKTQLLDYIDGYQVPESELDGPCLWYDLDRKLCKHHTSRPNVCRDFRVGSRGCRDWRAAYDIR